MCLLKPYARVPSKLVSVNSRRKRQQSGKEGKYVNICHLVMSEELESY